MVFGAKFEALVLVFWRKIPVPLGPRSFRPGGYGVLGVRFRV